MTQKSSALVLSVRNQTTELYDHILLEAPMDINALMSKGLILLWLRKNMEAIRCFELVTKADGSNMYAWRDIGIGYEMEKRFDVAVSNYKIARMLAQERHTGIGAIEPLCSPFIQDIDERLSIIENKVHLQTQKKSAVPA